MEHLGGQERMRAMAALATAVTLWAAAFVAIRAAIVYFTPGQMAFGRLAIASAGLVLVALSRRGLKLPSRRDLLAFLVLGATGQSVYHLLLNSGERTVDGGTASLLVSMAPILASVAAVAFLGERLSGVAWLGTGVAFAGAVTIALGAGASLSLSTGVVMIAVATLVWATFLVVQKTLAARYDSLELTAWPMWIGTALLLPFAGGLPHAVAAAPLAATGAIVFLGVCSSVLGFLAWAYAIQRLPVTVATSALFCVPVVALLIGRVALGEVPTTASLAGGALAFAGVSIVQVSGRVRAVRAARSAEALEAEA